MWSQFDSDAEGFAAIGDGGVQSQPIAQVIEGLDEDKPTRGQTAPGLHMGGRDADVIGMTEQRIAQVDRVEAAPPQFNREADCGHYQQFSFLPRM